MTPLACVATSSKRACARSLALVAGVLGALAGPAAGQKAPRPGNGSAAPAPPPTKVRYSDHAMGTNVTVWLWTADERGAAQAAEAVFLEMKRLDKVMTTWDPTSEVSQVNTSAGEKPVKVSADTFAVIARAMDISRRTRGVFDVTVGAFKGLWKFDDDMDGTLPDPAEVKKRLALINWRDVALDARRRTVFLKRKGMSITLGGIAKGFAVDRCADLLRKRGFNDFMIQAGGDMYVAGKKGTEPWTVAIRDPRGPPETFIAMAPIEDHSFSTSGDYERGFVKDGVRYHHILDPRTGQPARASRQVTVRARDAFTADAWSKALFILGPTASLELIKREKLTDFEVVWVDDKNQMVTTDGIKSALKVIKDPSPGP
jgi:thiamine biosynthesis lipoprotein